VTVLTPVTLSGNYLATAGRRFIPIGVNWVPARAAMQWPYEWDPTSVEADFAKMQDLGLNFVRLDLVWQWFEPRPGQYNEEAFQQFDFMIEMAHRYGVYLNPNFFVGGQVGDAYWDVPWRHGRHPHADPDMLRLQVRHVEEFARRYRGESSIIAWDLTDEPPFWIVGDSTTDAMAANWTHMLCHALRSLDPDHLIICGTAGQEVGRGPFRADVIARWVDLLSVHPYPIYAPDLYPELLLSTRSTYSAAFETMLSRGARKPVLLQEFGSTSAQFDPERQARYYNTLMYSALAAGNQGCIAWCFTDADPEVQYHRAPYKRNPHETQFGITDYQRNDLPHGREMRWVSQVLQQLDLEGIEPAPIEAGIIVPHEWAYGPDYSQYGFPGDSLYQYAPSNILNYRTDPSGQRSSVQSWLSSFILCRQAGIHVGFPREFDGWSEVPLILAPAPASDMGGYHLYTPFWQRARPHVEAGATLYASLGAASAIPMPDAIELFGANLADRALWRPQVQLTFIEDFLGIQAGETFEFPAQPGLQSTGAMLNVHDAQVLARDQDGQPALLARELGRGHAVLCAYPIEHMLAVTPNAFEDGADCWRLYRALKRLAGIQSPFTADRPEVAVGCLNGADRDYVILVNHTPSTVSGKVVARRSDGEAARILPEGAESVERAGSGWAFELPGFTGALFEWRHI
jgi:endo-1,4-beta-mannosidase